MATKSSSGNKSEMINKIGYIVLNIIGCGAYGKVYKVKDKKTNEQFAIKEIAYYNEVDYEIAMKEGVNGASLNHVYVVKFKEYFVDRKANKIFITMELCDYNLSEWFTRNNTKNRSYTEGMRMFREIAFGLQHIHCHNFIHRDLKPSNVLIKNNVCKISDLGFTMTTDLKGTPIYISPEQLHGSLIEKSSDIYVLGLILFQFFITFDNDSEFIACMYKVQIPDRVLPKNFLERYKHTSPEKFEEVKDLLRKMLAFDAKKRLTIQELLSHPFLVEHEYLESKTTQQNNVNNSDDNALQKNLKLMRLLQFNEGNGDTRKSNSDANINTPYIAAETNIFEVSSYEVSRNFLFRDETHTQSIQQNTFEINVDKYKYNFREMSAIGMGAFSTVFKAQCKSDSIVYAIKKVCFDLDKQDSVSKELHFLSKLDSKYVVKYLDSWIEQNYYIGSYIPENTQNISSSNKLCDPNLKYLLHIQMELCPLTLRDAINCIIKDCLTENEKTLTLIGYYVSSELFIELVECVQYLHSQNPPIIHRDLKPENILLTNCSNNRFVKLSDFGLSTFHEFADQSHTKGMGTKNYRALEVSSTSKYTTKADIYSLGIILHELLNFDNSEIPNTYLAIIESKFNYLINLSEKLLSSTSVKRPTCDVLLRESCQSRLSNEELFSDQQFTQIISKEINVDSIYNNFIEYFVFSKFYRKF